MPKMKWVVLVLAAVLLLASFLWPTYANYSIITLARWLEQYSGAITALATIIIAGFTWALCRATNKQAKLTREAIDNAKLSNQQDMRAYLSVIVHTAAYQDRANGIPFAGHPILKNNGRTPAYNVTYWCRAEIIPHNVVDGFDFAIQPGPELSQASIGPGEDRLLTMTIPTYVPDHEVAAIMSGDGKALWIWGTVHYWDAFGEQRYVNFSQRLTWVGAHPNYQVMGMYGHRFADSN